MKQPKSRKATNQVQTLMRLLNYLIKDYPIQLFIVAAAIFVTAFATVKGSLFLQIVIDDHVTPLLNTPGEKDFSGLLKAVITMGFIYLAGVITSIIFNQLMVTISQGSQKKIRDELFEHMETLPLSYFDTNPKGDVMSHYTNDIDTLRQMLSQSAPQLLQAIVTLFSVFIAMLSVSLPLTLFSLISITLMGFTIRKLSGLSGRYFAGQQKSLGEVNGYIEEMMNGQKVVKVFNHEQNAIEHFTKLNDELAENVTKANRYANILMPVMMNLLNIQYVLIAIIGGLLSINGVGALTIGGIAAFLQLSRSLNMPISQISQQINFIIMALAGAERIFNLMDEPSEVDNGTVTLANVEYIDGQLVECEQQTQHWAWKKPEADGTFTYVPLTGDVRFNQVDFSYTPEKKILKDITLFAKPGQKIAFVGATGAGKTTIINLINRFYDITKGEILYDGINIQDIEKDSLRRSLGIVLQETHLFTGTIKENIRYSKLDATDEEVVAAAKLANADYFISHLPQGYDTVITGDGDGLSQGQRQLLSIARAAIVDPPVMILDEATSSIDTRTERIVQEGMDALMKGRTVFVIAHRLSTIQNSDAIIVLDQGEIIERGDHDELLARKGTYYQLATGQLELD
ncbi:ABC transporter ATP-binding protein [Enterococcus alcedinis]|nr:ABC transporter ATP-binding protein [Enterococcus alcedinis]MBP2102860.1 ATP-binding cassette subfamily B protein [Enterococcus alcedinis]